MRFERDENGNFDDNQCCHCMQYDCDCDNLPDKVCKYCGRVFKGKHYFTHGIHQAICKFEKVKANG